MDEADPVAQSPAVARCLERMSVRCQRFMAQRLSLCAYAGAADGIFSLAPVGSRYRLSEVSS